jgi:opacity protein-like surface antigen
MRILPALTFAMLLVATPPVYAQDSLGEAYVGVRAIGSIAAMDDIDTTGFTGSQSIENDTDEVGGVGIIAGFRWADIPLRTEVEASYRFRFDLDARDNGPPAVTYESNVETINVLFNALLEWRNDSDFTPFIGGTIGWARNSSDTTRIDVPSQARTSEKTDSDNLAWGGMAGVDWHFAESWSVELAYRYIDLGEVDGGSFAAGDGIEADHYASHEALLSFSYRF